MKPLKVKRKQTGSKELTFNVPMDNSLPVFVFDQKKATLNYMGKSVIDKSTIKGSLAIFTLSDGAIFNTVNAGKNSFIPVDSLGCIEGKSSLEGDNIPEQQIEMPQAPVATKVEEKADVKTEGVLDGIAKEAKAIAKKAKDKAPKQTQLTSIAIGSGAGLLLGMYLKKSYPCCGKSALVTGVLIGGVIGYFYDKAYSK